MPYFKTISDYQDEITEWIEKNFDNHSIIDTYLGTLEEFGELCRAVVKRSQGIRGSYEEWTTEIQKELGDVLIKLFDIAQFEGEDLEQCFLNRWHDVRQRDWVKNVDGHGMPVED